ncbi:MAG: methyltransferase domain-containing protein [Gammaproteobacteria bacterium]|nr:methyltransferase domain-containing protein [Gammaproteobacteria bacterium]
MPKSDGYVSAEYLKKIAEIAQEIKLRSYELMGASEGKYFLDLGCGPGIDTIPLANIVGNSGRVCGIDIDGEMIAKANSQTATHGLGSIIQHQQGDVLALPHDDGSFDAVRAERLLQVLPKKYLPVDVLKEACRVTRKEGRLVFVDTDWGSVSVDYNDTDLERRLMGYFANCLRPNGYAGRQLPVLFFDQGLSNVAVEQFPIVTRDFSQTPFGDWLCTEALSAGVASRTELELWKTNLQARSDEGRFFSSVNIVVVCGIR